MPSQSGSILGLRGTFVVDALIKAVLLIPSVLVTLSMSPYSVSAFRAIGSRVRLFCLIFVVVSLVLSRVMRLHSMRALSANGPFTIPSALSDHSSTLARICTPSPPRLVFALLGHIGWILERRERS